MPDVDAAQIVNYLLGALPEEERARLEERFLRDAEYRELIRAVEDDLIDDYIRGDLAPRQRELFEKQFTNLPHRASKVEMAIALSKALGDEPRVDGWKAVASPKNLATPSRLVVFRYPLAAAAILVVGLGVWLVMGTRPSQPEVEQSHTAQATPPPKAVPRSAPDDPPPPAPQLSIATFLLPPGLVRDTTAARTFALPAGTQLVRLHLALEQADEYPAYRAELRTASGKSVWKADALRPQRDPQGLSVVLDVPADRVPPESYELTLTGISKAGADDIGYYYFNFATK